VIDRTEVERRRLGVVRLSGSRIDAWRAAARAGRVRRARRAATRGAHRDADYRGAIGLSPGSSGPSRGPGARLLLEPLADRITRRATRNAEGEPNCRGEPHRSSERGG